MADWYASSVAYAAIAQYANSHAYSVGDIVRQLASPGYGNERAFRCTTAGTSGGSEPSWTLTKGSTTNAGTAVFTEVTGNSTYGWAAAAARIRNMATWVAAGDTLYVASDSAETATAQAWSGSFPGTAAAPCKIISVSAAGSVPPVSADITAGASVTTVTSGTITVPRGGYFFGITFTSAGAIDSQSGSVASYFDTCTFVPAGANSTNFASGNAAFTVIRNCTITFSNTSQTLALNAPSNVVRFLGGSMGGSTVPTTLSTNISSQTTFEGVDLSAFGSGKTLIGAGAASGSAIAFLNCRLGASVTVAGTPTVVGGRVTVQISDSGATGYRQEIYDYAGTLTPETTIVETGGASDGVQALSWKVVSTANAKQIQPFQTFQIAQWNTSTGSSKTATIEIINDGTTLKNTEVWVEVEYLSSSSYPLASFVSSGTDVLAAGTSIPTSSVTWTTTGISSPVKQYLQVTFTPQMVGYVRATVYVGKASQTLYIDPKMTIA